MPAATNPDGSIGVSCSSCGRPLSGAGPPGSDPDTLLCDLFLATQAVSEIVDKAHESDQRIEAQKRHKVKASRPGSRNRWLFIGALTLIILAVNLVVYVKYSVDQVAPFAVADDPVSYLFMLDSAILEFAEDHEGNVPSDLAELVPEYLFSDEIPAEGQDEISYRQTGPRSYELILDAATVGLDEDVVLSGDDPR